MRRNPYIAIMRAAARGEGVKLSRDEVAHLSQDDAVETHAAFCLSDDQRAKVFRDQGWQNIDARARP